LICHTPGGRFADLLALLKQGGQLGAGGHKALIAIPTTAGTGSEVTPWATIWDQAAGQKYSLHQSCTWPEAAVIDAELMTSLPAGATLASGLDALSHALESIWNVNRNPVSMALAVQSARRTLATLPALMQDLGNAQLRSEMAEAALMAGLAFSNTKTALAHSLSYDITLQHGVPHGWPARSACPGAGDGAGRRCGGRCRLALHLRCQHACCGHRASAQRSARAGRCHRSGPLRRAAPGLERHGAKSRQRTARSQLHTLSELSPATRSRSRFPSC
jgi:hypothetical protein